jgi:hypothetical protein
MPRKEIFDRITKCIRPFRNTKGKAFQLKHFDPGDTCGLKLRKGEASQLLRQGTEWLAQERTCFTRPGALVAAARVSGDGCGWVGQHHQARDVWRESARLPGFLVQATVTRGPQPRLHVAVFQVFARAPENRDI